MFFFPTTSPISSIDRLKILRGYLYECATQWAQNTMMPRAARGMGASLMLGQEHGS